MSDPAASLSDPPLPHLATELEVALDTVEPSAISRRDAPRALLIAPSPTKLVWMSLEDWGALVACCFAMLVTPAWLYPLWAVLAAGRIHAFGVLLHDAAHMPLRHKTWRIRAIEALTGYPIASTLNAMRYHHLRHHKDSGMASDPYFKAGVEESRLRLVLMSLRGVLLVPFWTVRAPFGALASLVPSLRGPYARVFLQDRSGRPDVGETDEVCDCARAEWGQLVFQLGVVALAVRWPGHVLFLYVIPATISGIFAAYRLLCEHRYVACADRRPETILATTCDHNLDTLGRTFFGPRNIGFHVVHHLHPQVALEHLPALRTWYRERLGAAYPRPGRWNVDRR